MVLLTTTPRILSAISNLLELPLQVSSTSKTGHNIPPTPSALSSLPRSLDEPISHSSLVNLSQTLLSALPTSGSKYTLNSLLQGTQVYVPPPPPKAKPTKEYLALKAKLLKEQEQREYDRLLQKSHPGVPDDESEDDVTPSLVLNILLSVLLCGFAAFWATRYWSNQGLRVLLGMTAGLVVGVAEVVVYAAYLRKAKDARAKEARKKEVKITAEGEPGRPRYRLRSAGIEQDIIWGKGANGGIRRRVREQWEKEQTVER